MVNALRMSNARSFNSFMIEAGVHGPRVKAARAFEIISTVDRPVEKT
jgi:hypothetical protein